MFALRCSVFVSKQEQGERPCFYHIVRPSWPAFDHNCDLHEIPKSG